jgi:hypothetical protein
MHPEVGGAACASSELGRNPTGLESSQAIDSKQRNEVQRAKTIGIIDSAEELELNRLAFSKITFEDEVRWRRRRRCKR